jgi:polyisoprenoid-binding protein YceI
MDNEIDTTTRGQVTVSTSGVWTIDTAHSTVGAVARHLMVTKVRGRFTSFGGTVHVADPFEGSRVEVTIDASSIDTGTPQRDDHLRSADFLDVENHPTIEFRSTNFEPTGDATFRLDGDLTIRGVTQPVRLDAEYLGLAADPYGNSRIGFSATGEIDREDFGITWNQALEAGGMLVSKRLQIELDVQAIAAKAEEQVA